LDFGVGVHLNDHVDRGWDGPDSEEGGECSKDEEGVLRLHKADDQVEDGESNEPDVVDEVGRVQVCQATGKEEGSSKGERVGTEDPCGVSQGHAEIVGDGSRHKEGRGNTSGVTGLSVLTIDTKTSNGDQSSDTVWTAKESSDTVSTARKARTHMNMDKQKHSIKIFFLAFGNEASTLTLSSCTTSPFSNLNLSTSPNVDSAGSGTPFPSGLYTEVLSPLCRLSRSVTVAEREMSLELVG
jgi:hypothetical protein